MATLPREVRHPIALHCMSWSVRRLIKSLVRLPLTLFTLLVPKSVLQSFSSSSRRLLILVDSMEFELQMLFFSSSFDNVQKCVNCVLSACDCSVVVSTAVVLSDDSAKVGASRSIIKSDENVVMFSMSRFDVHFSKTL